MKRRDACEVIIIGAGVVGATAALALADAGLRVALVEARVPELWKSGCPDLRVYALAPDASQLLAALGVWPAVLQARAHAYRCMRIHDAGGGAELRFDADALGREHLGHIVEHGLLVDRLWAAVLANPAISRHCPAALAGISEDAEGVSATLEDGTALRARLLIGADGGGSRVRELAGFAVNVRDYAQRALVAYVQTAQPHEDTCWQRFLPGGPLAFLPCGDGRSSIVWTLPEAEAQRLLELDETGFCAELTRAFDALLGEVNGVSKRIGFALRRQLATEMAIGRIALIGDAAHVVHPLAGQGVNMGLRDVAALAASVVTAVKSGRDFAAIHRLQRWARTRHSENAVAAYAFEAINGVFSNDAVLPALLRGPLLGVAGRLPPLTEFFWKRAAGL